MEISLEKQNDHKLATLFVMMGMIDLFMRSVENSLQKEGYTIQHKPFYRYIKRIIEKMKGCHEYYDKILEISIRVGKSDDDKTEVLDALMNDYNLYLRTFLMTVNAMHGEGCEKRNLQLESTLKILTKDPVFDQRDIDKITNFQ